MDKNNEENIQQKLVSFFKNSGFNVIEQCVDDPVQFTNIDLCKTHDIFGIDVVAQNHEELWITEVKGETNGGLPAATSNFMTGLGQIMTRITREEVNKVAQLARLELNEHQINIQAEQLEKILDYIKQLEKINTDDVPCTTRAIEVTNVLRKDEMKISDCSDELLKLGPSREDKFYKVPRIINE